MQEISFGVWLHKQRRAMDLTRQALADQVGCAEVTLRRIEAGTLRPSKELAGIILEKLNIPKAELSQWVSFARGLSGFPLFSTPLPNKRITNLPNLITTFIGREKEQADVIHLISKYRLVTLTGSGGVGKTRLSLKVGEEVLGNYTDGVWIVELAHILDPLLVSRTTAIAIGLRDEPQQPVIDMLCDHLRQKKILLILDNCEHIIDACAQMADKILHSAPNVHILATSREVLNITGEAIYRVPSLGLPDIQHVLYSLRNFESINLFEERAQLAQFDFSLTLENISSVARICNRLDGIPLAIELAATKVGMLSTEQIADQLDENFNLLTGGSRTALPRHQTLHGSINWSWNLLTTSEQILMEQLSVFSGGWTLEAAQAICEVDVVEIINSLVRKSLIVANQDEKLRTRYCFHEAIRQYASERLIVSGQNDGLRNRHLEYFLNLAEVAEPYLLCSEQLDWLQILDTEHENLRLALEWSLNTKMPNSSLSLRLCKALGWFWQIRSYWREGIHWLTRALTRPYQNLETWEKAVLTRAFYTRAILNWQLGNLDQMLLDAKASFSLATEVANRRDMAISGFCLGHALFIRGEYDKAGPLMEHSFAEFQKLEDLFWTAWSYLALGILHVKQEKIEYFNMLLKRLDFARKTGERLILAGVLSEYADWLITINQVDEATQYIEESDNLYRQIESGNANLNQSLFAQIAWINGNYQKAKSLYIAMMERLDALGEKHQRSAYLRYLGLLAMDEGDLSRAQSYLEQVIAFIRVGAGKPYLAFCLMELSNILYLQGNVGAFKQNARESLSLKDYFGEYDKAFIVVTILGSLYFQKPECSARLLGVIHTYSGRKDVFPLSPVDKRYLGRVEFHARKLLGNGAFKSALADGLKMSLEDALNLIAKTIEEIQIPRVTQE